jgi:Tfp pilus assembly protein PilV
MPSSNRQNCGFSLVETLVATVILMSVVSGVMLLVDQSIRSGESITDRLAASYLAADAVEYLRYSRDSFWLADTGSFSEWHSDPNKGDVSQCGNGCDIDTVAGDITNQSGDPLEYDSSSRTYGYGSGQESKYTRDVQFIQTSSDEVTVEVAVSWPTSGGGTNEVVLVDTLSAWADD